MKTRHVLSLIGLTVLASCSWDGVQDSEKPNESPTVQITGGAAEGADADYRIEFNWSGADKDGTIDHFLYAIDDTCLCKYDETIAVTDPDDGSIDSVVVTHSSNDPAVCLAQGVEPAYASPDSIWRRTIRFSGSFAFRAGDETSPGNPPTGSEIHTFFIKAVDNQGAESRIDHRSFNAVTILPTVTILRPVGVGDTKVAPVSTFVGIAWQGRDEDAVNADKKPVGYQMKLIRLDTSQDADDFVRNYLAHTNPPTGWSTIRRPNLLIPDTLRIAEPHDATTPFPPLPGEEYYYETDWWPKPDAPYREDRIQLRNLPLGAYAFAVRAIDQAGAYYPNEILRNSIRFVTGTDAASRGDALKLQVSVLPVAPHITVTETNFLGSHTYNTPGETMEYQVPTNVPLHFEWSSDAQWYGAENGNMDFALDIPDPACEVCQSPNGVGGWIGWGSNHEFDVTFRDEDAGETHILYIRARDQGDSPDREALAVIVMHVVAFSFDKTALWIDDFKVPGIDDCEHDAIIKPMLEHAIQPYLRVGEQLDVFNARDPGLLPCTEQSDPEEITLSVLSRYKLLFWDVGASGSQSTLGMVTDPDPNAEFGKYLAIYVRAGGRLIVWGRFPVSGVLGDFFPTTDPYNPELPIFETQNFGPGTFLWDVLHLRTQFDRVGRSVIQTLSPPCSGIIGMEATQKAIDAGFPVGIVDPTGYDDVRTAIWWDLWDTTDSSPSGGRMSFEGGVGPEVPTGVPPLRVAGLDTLYTFVSNGWSWKRAIENPDYNPNDPACDTNPGLPQCQEWLSQVQVACGQDFGSPFEGEPYILRFDDPSSTQGRQVFVCGPLYFFTKGPDDVDGMTNLKTLMRKLTDWVFESGP